MSRSWLNPLQKSILALALVGGATAAVHAAPVMEIEIDGQVIPNNGKFDFGDVAVGWSADVFLRIWNRGPGWLRYETSATGPAVGDFDGLDGINGGHSEGYSVTSNVSFTPSATGLREVKLVVESNATENPYVVLIRGTGVVPPVMLVNIDYTPIPHNSAFDFGDVEVGQAVQTELAIQNLGPGILHYRGKADSDAIGDFPGLVDMSGSITTSQVDFLQFRFEPSTAGPCKATYTVQGNASQSPYVVAIVGTGVAPVMQVKIDGTPITHNNSFDFGNVELGQSVAADLQVWNLGPGRLDYQAEASGSQLDDFPGLSGISGSSGPDGGSGFGFRFKPTGTGRREAAFTVTSNATQSPYMIRIVGTGVQTPNSPPAQIPEMQVELNDIIIPHNGVFDFGDVELGETDTASLRIRNLGPGNLLWKVAGDGPAIGDFTGLDDLSATTAADASTDVDITFAPTLAGLREATLSIENNSAQDPHVIHLLGAGIKTDSDTDTLTDTVPATPVTIDDGSDSTDSASPPAGQVSLQPTGCGQGLGLTLLSAMLLCGLPIPKPRNRPITNARCRLGRISQHM